MSMFGGWMSSSARENDYITSMTDRANEYKQLHDLDHQRQRSRSRSPAQHEQQSHIPFDSDEEELDDYVSVSSSTAARRRKRNRSASPPSQRPPPQAPHQPPPPQLQPRPQQRVEINSTHDNAGLFNAGPYAGMAAASQQQQQQIPQEEPKQIAFDPFEEDFSEARKKDEETDGMDPSYCFLCIYSQTPAERERNPHYMSLLKIWYESYGKCSLVHLCTKVQEKYNDRIRKRNPVKYKLYSLVTIRDHFMDHIKSPEMFHVESIRFMDKVKKVTEKKVFTYAENNPKDVSIDSKQLSAWFRIQGSLTAAYAGLAGKRSRACKVLA